MSSGSRLRALAGGGQSVWIDWLTRDLLASGGLEWLIARHGVSGVTTNPTILEQAIAGDARYESQIAALTAAGLPADEVLLETVQTDVAAAADQLLPVWRRTRGRDGFVSWEVDPALAMDPRATLEAIADLTRRAAVPNLLVKIPATEAGVQALAEATAAGHSVNITLLFSVERYVAVAEAYLRGLERARAAGISLSAIASVASFFISRLDAAVDPILEADGSIPALALRGRLGIASAKRAYRHFRTIFSGARWDDLRAKGARPQRLLWASTSTKDARYRDVRYVEELIGRGTVTTLPRTTLDAFLDHGEILPATLCRDLSGAEHHIAALSRLGIDVQALAAKLEADGIVRFATSKQATLEHIECLARAAAA